MNKQELIEQLKKENVPESYYSFSEKNWGDVYVLLQEKEYWEVYYTERGNKYDIKHFDNEEEACEYFHTKVINMR